MASSISIVPSGRLAAAGFIRSRRPSPETLEIHLPSFAEHLRAVEADPKFWTRHDRMRRWRAALREGECIGRADLRNAGPAGAWIR